jgi:hypothetical protein
MIRKGLTAVAALAAASALMLTLGSAQAASSCKGLEKAACGKNASCIWVEGYTKKSGKKISGYCRTKSSHAKKATSKEKPKMSPQEKPKTAPQEKPKTK